MSSNRVNWAKAVMAFDADFNEGDHPRGEGGKFAAAASGHASKAAEHKTKHAEAIVAGNRRLATQHREAHENHHNASQHYTLADKLQKAGKSQFKGAEANAKMYAQGAANNEHNIGLLQGASSSSTAAKPAASNEKAAKAAASNWLKPADVYTATHSTLQNAATKAAAAAPDSASFKAQMQRKIKEMRSTGEIEENEYHSLVPVRWESMYEAIKKAK